MSRWQPIGADTPETERCLLWCSDIGIRGGAEGVCMGRIYRYSDGAVMPRGLGHHGEWNYTHWMALPDAPEA